MLGYDEGISGVCGGLPAYFYLFLLSKYVVKCVINGGYLISFRKCFALCARVCVLSFRLCWAPVYTFRDVLRALAGTRPHRSRSVTPHTFFLFLFAPPRAWRAFACPQFFAREVCE